MGKTALFLLSFIGLTSLAHGATDIVCDPASQNAALIVIDMQPGFVTRGGNADKPENAAKTQAVLDEQVVLIKDAVAKKLPIVFFEYAGGFGETNAKLKAALGGYKNVRYIQKTTDGMLDQMNQSRAEFVADLKKDKVGTLIITGANGGACVKESIQGSLDGNCTVIAYTKGIADFNYEQFIYPYDGHYKELKPTCASCKFVEVSQRETVEQEMARAQHEAFQTMSGAGSKR